MDNNRELEEKLRELSSTGDEETLCNILAKPGLNVNSQNTVNGWTALHWAAHRGHFRIASHLINHGADKMLKNNKGETALHLATDANTRLLLGGEGNGDIIPPKDNQSSFIPNYLANPPFPYVSPSTHYAGSIKTHGTETAQQHFHKSSVNDSINTFNTDELVIKARVANSAEKDFIEVEIERHRLTFDALVSTLCVELEVKRELIHKIRKLPDTIVRKDKDVQRLRDLQEIELVLSNKATSEMSRNYGPSVSPKHVDVVY